MLRKSLLGSSSCTEAGDFHPDTNRLCCLITGRFVTPRGQTQTQLHNVCSFQGCPETMEDMAQMESKSFQVIRIIRKLKLDLCTINLPCICVCKCVEERQKSDTETATDSQTDR